MTTRQLVSTEPAAAQVQLVDDRMGIICWRQNTRACPQFRGFQRGVKFAS